MKTIVSIFVLISCTIFVNGQFSKRLENLDVDSILKNDRILTNYIKCVLDQGPCTAEGRELRKTLPDALKAGCHTCNKKEKENTRKVVVHLEEHRAGSWEEIEKKFKITKEETIKFNEAVGI